MLENRRYNRAISNNIKYAHLHNGALFLYQEYLTQQALRKLNLQDIHVPPSEVSKVGSLFLNPELIPGLRPPYAVEVLGMPGTGKSTMINRYLTELWTRNERHKVTLVEEGASSIRQKYGDLRYSDPFTYSLLGSTATFANYLNINLKARMAISDRGQVDRRVFRRALFSDGHVSPQIMQDESEFMSGLENTPIQMGGIIMFMTRPEESLKRIKKKGPVVNVDFLPQLYEQYWRLHLEILQNKIPYRLYTCIDAEKDSEEVYKRFKYAMDTTLNIQEIYLTALSKAYPDEVHHALENKNKREPKKKRVLSIRGDE